MADLILFFIALVVGLAGGFVVGYHHGYKAGREFEEKLKEAEHQAIDLYMRGLK